MSLGPLMVDLGGTEITQEERELLRHPMVGGVILFTRNYSDPEQLAALVEDIHRLRSPHLIVAVDHEGGRVQRFRKGFTHLPPVERLGLLYDKNAKHALEMAEVSGWLMASELRAFGIDISFAPVLDLAHGVSGVIGDRAFHRKPEPVADLATAYIRGMRMAGMAATGKHFPGHGAVREDSHISLPVDKRRYADIAAADLVPFERLIHAGLEGVMTAHVVYTQIDPQPATFSREWIRGVLRQDLGFQGVVFSDDLSMGGAADQGSYADRARAALEAGCDMLPVCNNPEGALEIIDDIGRYDDPAAHLRLIRLHGRGPADRASLFGSSAWRVAVEAVQSYDHNTDLELQV